MTTVELQVTGMHCESCTALIAEVLADHEGVTEVAVDLDTSIAVVGFDADRVEVPTLCAAIEEAGYGASPTGGPAPGH